MTDTDLEVWVPISGYEGIYEVSSLGQVISLGRTVARKGRHPLRVKGRLLKPSSDRKGYLYVGLNQNGVAKTRAVHRLVCAAFHGSPPEGFQAAHDDGVPANCRADNLSWKSVSDNARDRHRHGTMLLGEDVPNSKLTRDQAIGICKAMLDGGRPSQVGRLYGVSESMARKIRDGEAWATFTLKLRRQYENGPSAIQPKTHCKAGHPFAGSNLYIARTGQKKCRACQKQYDAQRSAVRAYLEGERK